MFCTVSTFSMLRRLTPVLALGLMGAGQVGAGAQADAQSDDSAPRQPVAPKIAAVHEKMEWEKGDRVEVKWGGQWYKAEILEAKNDLYRIHYEGYGSNWDEWVTPGRIRPTATVQSVQDQPTMSQLATSTKSGHQPSGGSWKVGDKVEAWNVTWYKATILEIGTGQYKGYYKVRYEGFSISSE